MVVQPDWTLERALAADDHVFAIRPVRISAFAGRNVTALR